MLHINVSSVKRTIRWGIIQTIPTNHNRPHQDSLKSLSTLCFPNGPTHFNIQFFVYYTLCCSSNHVLYAHPNIIYLFAFCHRTLTCPKHTVIWKTISVVNSLSTAAPSTKKMLSHPPGHQRIGTATAAGHQIK